LIKPFRLVAGVCSSRDRLSFVVCRTPVLPYSTIQSSTLALAFLPGGSAATYNCHSKSPDFLINGVSNLAANGASPCIDQTLPLVSAKKTWTIVIRCRSGLFYFGQRLRTVQVQGSIAPLPDAVASLLRPLEPTWTIALILCLGLVLLLATFSDCPNPRVDSDSCRKQSLQ
jgi:hypothetical protein